MKDRALRQFLIKSTFILMLVSSITIALLIKLELVDLSWWWVGFPLLALYAFGNVLLVVYLSRFIGEYEDEA